MVEWVVVAAAAAVVVVVLSCVSLRVVGDGVS
jgi:hypothetical protein